ncbi:MAG TPA: Ig-like domain-containing protein, partial [Microcoleaceae cyanobacterium]
APFDRYDDPTAIDSAGNTTSTAFQIGTLQGTGNYRGLASSSDSDYYQFVLTDDTTISLSLNGVSGSTLTLSGDGISGTETPSGTISDRVLAAGTYYIRVAQSTVTSTEYQLTLTGIVNTDYPTIAVGLANDTTWYDLTNEDGITSDPTVTGEITSVHGVSALQARFTNASSQSFVNIQSWLQSGSFTLDATTLNSIYGGALPQGDNILEFRVTDTRGAITTETLTIHLDTLAPTAPTNLILASVGSTAIRVSGSAEAGALVQLFDDGEDPIAEVWATATGSWSITTSQLRNGIHNLTAQAIDIAGNVSTLSTPLNTTITTLVPSAPQDLRLTAATDTGTSTADGITTDHTPQITGNAEAGTTVRVWREQQLLGETVADTNGE